MVEHKDPLGFDVRTPQGWGVTTAEGSHIVIRSADKSVFIVVQPFLLKKATHAADWIDASLQQMQTLLPQAEVQQKRQIRARPDEAAATAGYTIHGRAGQANMLCSIVNGSGMLYAIAAPRDVFTTQKPMLLGILHTFHFIQPTASVSAATSAGGATGAVAPLSYVKWTEPKEHAFTEEVPRGWKTEGGLLRRSQVDTRTEVTAISPDGQIRLQVGESTLPNFFTLPQPNAAEFHRQHPLVPQPPGEGTAMTLRTGASTIIMHYRSGADFSHVIAQLKFGKQHPELKLEESKELAPPPDQQIRAAGNSTVTAGATDFTYQENGIERSGFVYASTRLMPYRNPALGGTWYCSRLYIGTYPAASGLRNRALEAVDHIANTTVYDPRWYQRQNKTTAEATQAYVAAVAKEMDSSHKAFMSQMEDQREDNTANFKEHMHEKDENTRHFTNMILGQKDMRDPITGEKMKVASGHNYYWHDGDKLTTGDLSDRPNVNLSALEEW